MQKFHFENFGVWVLGKSLVKFTKGFPQNPHTKIFKVKFLHEKYFIFIWIFFVARYRPVLSISAEKMGPPPLSQDLEQKVQPKQLFFGRLLIWYCMSSQMLWLVYFGAFRGILSGSLHCFVKNQRTTWWIIIRAFVAWGTRFDRNWWGR